MASVTQMNGSIQHRTGLARAIVKDLYGQSTTNRIHIGPYIHQFCSEAIVRWDGVWIWRVALHDNIRVTLAARCPPRPSRLLDVPQHVVGVVLMENMRKVRNI